MESAKNIIKNSFWISIQPLLLNVISLFIVGYIASTLGQEDYGIFVFAFSMVTLFTPLGNFGLRAITVRDVAAARDGAGDILGKIFMLRLFLTAFTYILLVGAVNILNYPPPTHMVVYIAGILLFPNTAATVFFDGFQAFERMKYMAYANFISGIILTASSVVILYSGYRLVGLTIVYLLGNFFLFAFAAAFYMKNFPSLKMQIDLTFFRENLKKGMPFFLTGLFGMLNTKIGIIILSKLEGNSQIGLYGAASNLTDRLLIIPDSLGTAIFPTIAILYIASKKEAVYLFGRFFHYLILISLPIAVGITMLSSRIIHLIYGPEYASSALTLSILAWSLPGLFNGYLLAYFLNAVHLEHMVLKFTFGAAGINIALNFILIPYFHQNGVAIALFFCWSLYGLFNFYLAYKHFSIKIGLGFLSKVIFANALLSIWIFFLNGLNIFITILASGSLYIASLFILKLMNGDDWNIIRESLFKRGAVNTANEKHKEVVSKIN